MTLQHSGMQSLMAYSVAEAYPHGPLKPTTSQGLCALVMRPSETGQQPPATAAPWAGAPAVVTARYAAAGRQGHKGYSTHCSSLLLQPRLMYPACCACMCTCPGTLNVPNKALEPRMHSYTMPSWHTVYQGLASGMQAGSSPCTCSHGVVCQSVCCWL